MKKAAAHSTTIRPAQNLTTVKLSSPHAMLDTAWRIVAPVGAFTLLGVLADERLTTRPWLALLGLAIGFGLASILVNRQIISKNDE